MAQIKAATNEKVFQITAFRGLNQNPDGDTKLKYGEAAVVENFRVTRDGNLQRRPGLKTIIDFTRSADRTGALAIVDVAESNWYIPRGEGDESLITVYDDDGGLWHFDIWRGEYDAIDIADGENNLWCFLEGEAIPDTSATKLVAITAEGGEWRFPVNAGGTADLPIDDAEENAWHLKTGNGDEDDLSFTDTWNDWYVPGEEHAGDGAEDSEESDGYPIKGLWTGYVSGVQVMLCAYNGMLYKMWDEETEEFYPVKLGPVSTEHDVFIFGFSDIVYILDKDKYRQWDGETLKEVAGYIPLVMTNIPPEGGTGESATLENVNRLIAKRRVWLSPDGSHASFKLPEAVKTIDAVRDTGTGAAYSGTYTFNASTSTITFTTAPAAAVNSIDVEYSVETVFRSQVEQMQYAELFSGTQDTRIFLYGDGTNRCIYSGIDYNGVPRADYFPDLYECLVGDENTPITGMIRHYSSLACFKTNSAWNISAGSMTLADGLKIPSFYVAPINKEIGCAAMGQVRLVLNSPLTLFGNDLYEWKSNSRYSANLNRDERVARRISDRVWAALKSFDTERCYCFDDNDGQEYYICHNKEALIYNYAADAWSYYTAFPVSCMVSLNGECYIGTLNGRLKHLSTNYLDDDGKAIRAYWESGSMSFGQEFMRKYSAMTFICVKPEGRTALTVGVRTDKKLCESKEILTNSYQFDFGNVNFSALKWEEKRDAQIYREKIKAKKFVFYKLLLQSMKAGTRCTVLSADIRVRFTGFAK